MLWARVCCESARERPEALAWRENGPSKPFRSDTQSQGCVGNDAGRFWLMRSDAPMAAAAQRDERHTLYSSISLQLCFMYAAK